MSRFKNNNKSFGPSQRNFDQDISFGPFEVVDFGDSKVGINEGVLVVGHSAIAFNRCQFTGSVKPQNLMGDKVDQAELLTVEKGDWVCIVVKDAEQVKPTVEIKALKPEDLGKDENKRKKNRIYKIAYIKDSVDKTIGETTVKFLDIQNYVMSNIISETENWPAFTPIIWEEESPASASPSDPPQLGDCPAPIATEKKYKAIFIPGSITLPQTMKEAVVFKINGKSMLDLPIIDVSDGDEYFVEYSISDEWGLVGDCNFKKITSASEEIEIVEVIPMAQGCSSDGSGSGGTPTDGCGEATDGSFTTKILSFEKSGDSLRANIFWKSDFLIYGWKRCSDCDSDSSSSDSNSSGSVSDTSVSNVSVSDESISFSSVSSISASSVSESSVSESSVSISSASSVSSISASSVSSVSESSVSVSSVSISSASSTSSVSVSSVSESSVSESSVSISSISEESSHDESISYDSSSDGSISGSDDSISGSDKSTAIVPAHWQKTKYTALFTEESPDVRFHDVLEADIRGRITVIPMDFRYVSVCEPGTIKVASLVGDNTGGMGAKIVGDDIIIKSSYFNRSKSVTISLTAIRRGFLGMRFPARTRKQFIANEEFLNSAYPKL